MAANSLEVYTRVRYTNSTNKVKTIVDEIKVYAAVTEWRDVGQKALAGATSAIIYNPTGGTSTDLITAFKYFIFRPLDQDADLNITVNQGDANQKDFTLRIPAGWTLHIPSNRSYDKAFAIDGTGTAWRTNAAGGPNDVIDKITLRNAADATVLNYEAHFFN